MHSGSLCLVALIPSNSTGIFGCYFYYGVVQEKITRGTYGAENERYYYTMFLVFCQCIINALFAKGLYDHLKIMYTVNYVYQLL